MRILRLTHKLKKCQQLIAGNRLMIQMRCQHSPFYSLLFDWLHVKKKLERSNYTSQNTVPMIFYMVESLSLSRPSIFEIWSFFFSVVLHFFRHADTFRIYCAIYFKRSKCTVYIREARKTRALNPRVPKLRWFQSTCVQCTTVETLCMVHVVVAVYFRHNNSSRWFSYFIHFVFVCWLVIFHCLYYIACRWFCSFIR